MFDAYWKDDLDISKNEIQTVSAGNLKRLYQEQSEISDESSIVLNTKKVFDFFHEIFKGENYKPKMSQVDFRRLAWIAHTMPRKLNVKKFKKEFADAYIQFDLHRNSVLAKLREGEIDETNHEAIYFKEYTEKARAYDASGQKTMDTTMRSYIIDQIPEMEPLANKRNFADTQRKALLFKAKNKCTICQTAINIEDMEADHIIAFSNGGKTTLANGQALCIRCNREKSDN